jgi:hypothetical protein
MLGSSGRANILGNNGFLIIDLLKKGVDQASQPCYWKTQGNIGSLDRARYNTLGCIEKELEFGNEAQYLIRS